MLNNQTPLDPFSEKQAALTAQVKGVMRVESVTHGGPGDKFLASYRGELIKDSIEAYDQLSETLKPLNITPLFRKDENNGGTPHNIIMMDGTFNSKPSNPWVNLVLFILTLVSTIYAGAMYSYAGPIPETVMESLLFPLRYMETGIPFGLSLLAILLAHEFGHYLMGRYHKADVTLPYFIPMPLSILGTMGAFIQLKSPPKNRRSLHDIGVAGPLAGLVVAIPILLIGLYLSPVELIEPVTVPGQGFMLEGNSILYLAAKYIIHGELLPAPESYGGVPPLLYWLRFVFTGYPAPFGMRDVLMHPLAWAGWAGLLVTALNLIPAGQLDGGHALYVLFGRKARRALPFILDRAGSAGSGLARLVAVGDADHAPRPAVRRTPRPDHRTGPAPQGDRHLHAGDLLPGLHPHPAAAVRRRLILPLQRGISLFGGCEK